MNRKQIFKLIHDSKIWDIDSEDLIILPLDTNDKKDFELGMQKVFGEPYDGEINDMYKIKVGNNIIGYIGLSKYPDDGYLGIGNFMILPEYQSNGYGTRVIEKIIDTYKSQYYWIYAFVDPSNSGAINLYNRIGKVEEDITNDDGEYRVTFYKRKK